MRRRFLIAAACAALAFAVAGTAIAAGSLTLTASRTAVQFPHGVRLFVGFPTEDPANSATILQRIAGESVWTTASVDVTSSVCIRPTKTAAYVADVDGVQSDPVTVTVAARLTKPTICRSHETAGLVVKGKMFPAEDGAEVTVTFYHKETTDTVTPDIQECQGRRGGRGHKPAPRTVWVEIESRTVTLMPGNPMNSKWSTEWTPTMKGPWKIVVSHEDVTHAFSSATSEPHKCFKRHHRWH